MSADDSSFKELDAYIASALLLVTSLYYIPFLGFFIVRRAQCPLINRSPNIVLLSAITNYLLTICLLLPKLNPFLEQNDLLRTWLCKGQGAAQILHIPFLLGPYGVRQVAFRFILARAYRLYVVFKLNVQEGEVIMATCKSSATAFSKDNLELIKSV